MSAFEGMSVLTGHFELTGLPSRAAAVSTRSSARNADETVRLIRSPPTILKLRLPAVQGFDYFFSPCGGVPDFAQILMAVLLAQSGLCFTSYWESPVSPQ